MARLLTTKDVMRKYQVSQRTVYNWRYAGLEIVRVGGLVRYDEDAVERWVRSQNEEESK